MGDESIFFAVGTHLIGEWSKTQPDKASTYLVQTDEVEWELVFTYQSDATSPLHGICSLHYLVWHLLALLDE